MPELLHPPVIQSTPSRADELPHLRCGEVHAWHMHLDDGNGLAIPADFRAVLSEDECDRADRYRFDKDRHQFVVSRGFLRILLGRYLEQPPQEVKLGFGEFGKPFVESTQPLHFNLGHSGNHVVFAFSPDREIGIDVEDLSSRRHPMADLIHRICTPSEAKTVEKMQDVEAGLIRLWTAKEAYLKALGTGFQIEPNQIEIEKHVLIGSSDPSHVKRFDDSKADIDHTLYPLPSCEAQLGCSIAIAVLHGTTKPC